ncbi:hypothetical protein FA13DRAFT_1715231 [Coprinellus micaceus]|uniref:Uncharacterized protein n=1 Tax=Coprinellus micaceus TaxID=71717 RepID=A0A4Y7SPQ4_COPMI|nr:hypothetical protein FA13DRAFT_1715231 [Coprinellus micaceus]
MPTPWPSHEQDQFLVTLIPHFLEAQRGKSTTAFYVDVFSKWFKKWPLPDDEVAAKKGWHSTKSGSKIRARRTVEDLLRRRQESGRALQAIEIYQRTHGVTIEPKVVKAMATEELSLGRQLNNSEKLSVRRATVEKLWLEVPDDVRVPIIEQAEKMKREREDERKTKRRQAKSRISQAAESASQVQRTTPKENEGEGVEGTGQSVKGDGDEEAPSVEWQTPADYEKAIQFFPKLFAEEVEAWAEATGWCIFAVAAGPVPSANGATYLQDFYSGPNSRITEGNFFESYPDFGRNVRAPFINFVTECYSEYACRDSQQQILTATQALTKISARTLLSHPGSVSVAVGVPKLASNAPPTQSQANVEGSTDEVVATKPSSQLDHTPPNSVTEPPSTFQPTQLAVSLNQLPASSSSALQGMTTDIPCGSVTPNINRDQPEDAAGEQQAFLDLDYVISRPNPETIPRETPPHLIDPTLHEQKAAAEKAAAERAEAERVASEKAAFEKAEAEKAEAEKVAAERAEAERAVFEKTETMRAAAAKRGDVVTQRAAGRDKANDLRKPTKRKSATTSSDAPPPKTVRRSNSTRAAPSSNVSEGEGRGRRTRKTAVRGPVLLSTGKPSEKRKPGWYTELVPVGPDVDPYALPM